MTITDNLDGTFTLAVAPEEYTVIAWARAYHSPTILEEVLSSWLRGETRFMQSSAGETAMATIQSAPLASLEQAVDSMVELSSEAKARLKSALSILHGGGQVKTPA